MISVWLPKLVAAGIITQAQADEALQLARQSCPSVETALVQLGHCSWDDILTAKAESYRMERVRLDQLDIPADVIELIPESVARENRILPLEERPGSLVIAISNPDDLDTVEKLRFILNRQIALKLATEEEIGDAINRYYGQGGDDSLQVLQWEQIENLPDYVFLGTAFVFVGQPADKTTPRSGLFPPPARKVLSRMAAPVLMPGVRVGRARLPRAALRSISSDKLLYQAGRDTVHVLVVSMGNGGDDVSLRVVFNQTEVSRRSVPLDERGCGTLELRNLQPGEYSIRWDDGVSEDEPCQFTVAEYQLAPLVAELLDRTASSDGKSLTVRLRLESFGRPVQGNVQLEVTDHGRVTQQLAVVAQSGIVAANIELRGSGPHEIHARLGSDASSTATVRLTGSRLDQRTPTVFSRLGKVISASLLTGKHSTEARGLHFASGSECLSPVLLERADGRSIRLRITQNIEALHCVLVDALTETVQPDSLERETVLAGETIELATTTPLAFLLLGGFVQGEPWEGIAAIVRPTDLQVELSAPQAVQPGETASIAVQVQGSEASSVYLVVKDARLAHGETPHEQLAGCIKKTVDGAPIAAGPVKQTLRNACYSQSSSADSILMEFTDTAIDFYSTTTVVTSRRASLAGGTAAPPARRPAEAADTVFAGLLMTNDGRAETTITVPDALTEYSVQAYVFAGGDWTSAEARFAATKEAFVELQLPAFLARGDEPVARLHVSATATSRVELTCNGEPVELFRNGERYAPDKTDRGQQATLQFAARPGEYVATLRDESGQRLDQAMGRIESLGSLRRTTRSIRFLSRGERLSRDDDPSIAAVRLLPGLDRPFGRLCEATADYSHCCCEQTAAKVLAGCAMYVFAGHDAAQKRKAEEIILLGIQRQQRMWLPGRGFKIYPDVQDSPSEHFGSLAARHLRYLDLLRDTPLSAALDQGVTQGLRMAADVQQAQGIAWPPVAATDGGDAYAMVRFGDHSARLRGLEYVRRDGREGSGRNRLGREFLAGAVGRRMESAYASAALFRGGVPGDMSTALRLANEVVGDLNGEGRLYSTADSVAAIALLNELLVRRLLGGGSLFLNGRLCSANDPLALAEEVREVAAEEGTIALEVTRTIEEDWENGGAATSHVPVNVTLQRSGEPRRRLTAGDAAELVITLPRGYQMGDLAWVCLPAALARLTGGGQVKRFAVDFAGQSELRIPLAAIGSTINLSGQLAREHIVVRVRNMYEEERCGSPEPLAVTVGAGGI